MNDTGNKNWAIESECGPFHLSQLRGAQSIVFTKAPYLLSAASVAGSKEAQGPLGKCFDLTNEDDLFGAETWEEAESNMQKEACVLALGKSHVDPKSVRYLFGGDLLRQGIATSMGVEDLQVPIFGLYGACSTSGEALALVGGVVSSQGSKFFESGVVIFVAVFLHNGLGYLLGYGAGKLTGMNTAKKRTISIEVGMQNAGLATNLATTTAQFASTPESAIICAVSCTWHSISGTLLAGMFAYYDKFKEDRESKSVNTKEEAV